jgi:alkanesulfonate monooxygenase
MGFDYEGRYYAVDSGGFSEPLNVHAFPRVFLSGDSPEALALGAKHGDVHLLAADTALDDAVADLTRRADAVGRTPRVGLTLPVIAREENGEAADRVIRLLAERGSGTKADVDALSVAEGVWSGFDRLGFDSPIGLLGSYTEVEAAIRGYVERGVEVFILDGYPHTEEAYRVGQHLLPLFNAPALAAERH